MYTLSALLKNTVKKLSYQFLKRLGIIVLTKQETEEFLAPFLLTVAPGVPIVLPGVENLGDPTSLIFSPTEAATHPTYVWLYIPGYRKTVQLPYGAVWTGTRVLCTDFDSAHLVKNFLLAPKRAVVEHEVVIALWSHFLDGIAFGGYYDFVILVAAKLCRIKEALPAAVFQTAALAYPLFDTAYEQEYLTLIGVEPDRIIDSRQQQVVFKQGILANSGHWFYPNAADISALKKHVEGRLNVQKTKHNRIYVSRTGRRCITNEAALIQLLKKYNFTIIEDKPRSVAEQVDIYKNASFIIGPHGASFTNIIWCEPGTHLLELFSTTMVVGHFRYLAQLMKMTYSAYHHAIKMGNSRQVLEEDIFVSIADLEKILDGFFVPA